MHRKRNWHVLSEDHVLLGKAVRELRARVAVSQEELGRRADLHRNYVGAIERGEINPTFRTLLRLCGGLRVPPEHLMGKYEEVRWRTHLYSEKHELPDGALAREAAEPSGDLEQ